MPNWSGAEAERRSTLIMREFETELLSEQIKFFFYEVYVGNAKATNGRIETTFTRFYPPLLPSSPCSTSSPTLNLIKNNFYLLFNR